MKKQENDNGAEYTKFGGGIFIVKAENSSFNADFTRTPRRLPDENGTIFATDKALKYCIRKYLLDKSSKEKSTEKNDRKKIFGWRRKSEQFQPLTLVENYKKLFGKLNAQTTKPQILENLLNCKDVRLFGITFAPKDEEAVTGKNISIVGPVQISYGINKFEKNEVYPNQILSPYRNPSENSKDAQQTTTGEESKALEVHYVYDFIVNPNHIIKEVEYLGDEAKNYTKLLVEDVEDLKEALCRGVNNVNSTTKIGSEGELLIYIEYEQTKPFLLQNLKHFIKINKNEDGKTDVDVSLLLEYLKGLFTQEQATLSLYYDAKKTKIIPDNEDALIIKYNILTMEKIGV